ncbi:hypothetical protein KGQ24_00865 [Patescibacteria group bacterium]|nr:hypothetical protein [Patescibacteria group bacterium]
MILFLNTAGFERLHFAVISGKRVKSKKISIKYPETEMALAYLDKFLREQKVKPVQIKKIIAVSGEGSFTGIRVGFALASAFSLALGIPVYAIESSKLPSNLSALNGIKLKKRLT